MTSVMFKSEQSLAEVHQIAPGGMRSVLLHVQDDAGLEARLQVALDIVRASGGHIACMQIAPVSGFAGYDPIGGSYGFADMILKLEEQEVALRERLEARLANEDVAWTYARQTAEPASALVASGALADLIVMGRAQRNQGAPQQPLSLIGDVLSVSHTPLLVCPDDGQRFDPFAPAVVAWNGSFEAANALRAALPLLRQASSVHIVTIDEDKALDFPPLGASEYLSRHDIHPEMLSEHRGTRSVGERLVATAQSLGAGHIVMGAYGHSRAREYLLGGVTREMLKHSPLPLLLSR